MTPYLLKSGVLLILFYIVYKLWLENEKMFRFNRAYLLLSLVFSFIIPLRIISFGASFSTKIGVVQLDELVIRKSNENLKAISDNDFLMALIVGFYVVVVLLLAGRFIFNVYSFYKKIKENEVVLLDGAEVVLMDEPLLPHSFWRSIFVNKDDFIKDKVPAELVAHEKAHLEQKHTFDVLFVEVLQIVFWFNPLLLFYKRAIKLNHEFLADQAVNKQFQSVKNYQNLLLSFAANRNTIELASSINYLLTKKRLLMMTKKESQIKIMCKVFGVGVVYALVLFIFSTEMTAQKMVDESNSKDKSIHKMGTEMEKKPNFPGGINEFYKFIGQNYKEPVTPAGVKLSGKVYITFIIEKDGSLSDFRSLRDIGYGTGAEAIRVLKMCPKWSPGYVKGKPVRVQYALPITVMVAK
jgi:beta-lactamase regulating signal transducer with metallopeptidase domain